MQLRPLRRRSDAAEAALKVPASLLCSRQEGGGAPVADTSLRVALVLLEAALQEIHEAVSRRSAPRLLG